MRGLIGEEGQKNWKKGLLVYVCFDFALSLKYLPHMLTYETVIPLDIVQVFPL